MENQILLSSTTRQELVTELLSGISEILKRHSEQDINSKEWLTAKETQSLLKITAVTLWNYDKKGITIPHRIGTRKRYRKDEVIEIIKRKKSK